MGNESARLFFAFSWAFAISIASSTKILNSFFGYDHLTIHNYSASPIEWLAFVLIIYTVLDYRWRLSPEPSVPVDHFWIKTVAGVACVATSLFAIFVSHPDDLLYHRMEQFILTFHVTGGPLFAAFLATVIVLPFFPAYVFIDPSNAIKRWKDLIIIFCALLGCFLSIVLEALYAKFVLPHLINILTNVLLLFSWNVYANIRHNIVSVDGFRVIIGPACVGLTYIFLFLLFFGYLLFGLYKQGTVDIVRSFLAGVLGLCAVFFLNIVRIASLLLLGRFFPSLALVLFHSVVGSVYFFLFFIIYFPLVRWWICGWKAARRT